MKDAMAHWLKFGVFGIQVSGVESFTDSTLLSDWKNVTSQYSGDDDARVLIAATSEITPQRIFSLLNMTEGADLLTSQYLLGLDVDSPERKSGDEIARMIKNYISAAGNRSLSWSVGGPQVGHMASLVGERLLRLYHVLLFTLPGTPFVDYGDEIGLEDLPKLPGQPASFNMTRMQWNNQHNFGFSESSQNADSASNVTVQSQDGDKTSVLALFRALSDLRGKERSLLHGEFVSLGSDQPDVCAYLRRWDQNERFLVLLNFGDTESAVSLTPPKAADLLTEAAVVLSTDPQRGEGQLSLRQLKLGASEGLLLRFPYVA
uniref:Solute carrier family 3 member 2 n=1 Tax=Sphenodon punctatus TaxID=8508 RepID=A0A8D0GUP5_SPHPU